MPRACYLLALALLLWPSSAHAQPGADVEHHWAILVEGRRFGLVQVVQIDGGFRRTEVWAGWWTFDINGRAAEAIVLAQLSPGLLIPRIDWRSFRRVSFRSGRTIRYT
jgi:hypothetical protein